MRIAILEDDPSQLELFSHWLTSAGYQPVQFERGADFLYAIGQEPFEMLIVDWNLPDATGIDILRRVRQTSKVPVLFCTARADQDDVVRALREGADDYLIKPLRRLELLARIESVARRARKVQDKDEVFELDEYKLDCSGRVVSRAGVVVELTDKDFDLAVLFFRNVGRLLSRRQIHEAVWGTIGVVTSRTLDTHVSRIRNKLGLMPRNGWQLKSVYAHGYRLQQVPREVHVGKAA
jgi:two-component system response regulator RegX3